MRHLNKIFILALFITAGFAFNIAGSDENLKIASIFSHGVKSSDFDRLCAEGVKDAVLKINSQGGVNGLKIDLKEIDNLNTSIGSYFAAEEAVKQNVTAIIGAAGSDHSLAVAKVAQKHKIPMISPASTHPALTQIGEYIFRTCFNDSSQGRVMAKFAIEDLRKKTATILTNAQSAYSVSLSDEFKTYFESMGGEVLLSAMYKYTYTRNDLGTIIQEIKKADSEIIFVPGVGESGIILNQLRRNGIHAVFLGGDSWASDVFFRNGGKELKSAYYCANAIENIEKFSSEIKSKYKENYGIFYPYFLAYDTAFLLVDAIKRAGSLNREKIARELSKIDFYGVSGGIAFDKNGDPVKKTEIIRVYHGNHKHHKFCYPAGE